MNYSFFRDAPVVPKSLDKNLPNKFYYTEYTSETFKLLSKTINGLVGDDSFFATNPIHAENVFRSWTGGLGRYIIDTLDYGTNNISYKDFVDTMNDFKEKEALGEWIPNV